MRSCRRIGKKQLNQLITFLDKGVAKDGLGGRSDNALRSVRAKREAEEADKEYRKGVHWLETLRLRRIKTLESGYKVDFRLPTSTGQSDDAPYRVLKSSCMRVPQ
jgi:hypothetical protein